MKKLILFIGCLTALIVLRSDSCDDGRPKNTTALDEQARTEVNQRGLFATQPPPTLSWSMERDNLIKRFKLQNDRTVNFFMYIFIEGQGQPIGYYQVNKVSSVNSQLTNTMQLVDMNTGHYDKAVLPSPAEDGSYGTNGDAVFGFTPEDIYIETNMKYITSIVPLTFERPVNLLAVINTDQAKEMLETSKKAMSK